MLDIRTHAFYPVGFQYENLHQSLFYDEQSELFYSAIPQVKKVKRGYGKELNKLGKVEIW